MIDVLINSMERLLSQGVHKCVHMSNHHDVHFKYITNVFVGYTLIKLR